MLPAVFSRVWMISSPAFSQLPGIASIVPTIPSIVARVSSSSPIFRPSSTTRRSSSTRASVSSSKPAFKPLARVSLSSSIVPRVSGPISMPVASVSLMSSTRSSVFWSRPLVVVTLMLLTTSLAWSRISEMSPVQPAENRITRVNQITSNFFIFPPPDTNALNVASLSETKGRPALTRVIYVKIGYLKYSHFLI